MKIILQTPDEYCPPDGGPQQDWVGFFNDQDWYEYRTLQDITGQWDHTQGTTWLFYYRIFNTNFGFLLNGSRRMILLSRFGHKILHHFKLVSIDQGLTWGELLALSGGDVFLGGAMSARQGRSAVSVIERYLRSKDLVTLGEAYEVVAGNPEHPSAQDRAAYPDSTGLEVVRSITSITRVMDRACTSRPTTILPTVTAIQEIPAPEPTTESQQIYQNHA